MKGFFSRLAQQTGLSYGSGQPDAALSSAPAQRAASAQEDPLAVSTFETEVFTTDHAPQRANPSNITGLGREAVEAGGAVVELFEPETVDFTPPEEASPMIETAQELSPRTSTTENPGLPEQDERGISERSISETPLPRAREVNDIEYVSPEWEIQIPQARPSDSFTSDSLTNPRQEKRQEKREVEDSPRTAKAFSEDAPFAWEQVAREAMAKDETRGSETLESSPTGNADFTSRADSTLRADSISGADSLRSPAMAQRKEHHDATALRPATPTKSESKRAESFQDELRELREWLNQPPEFVDETASSPSPEKAERSTDAFVPERESVRAERSAQRARAETPPEMERQDFNLSIGTISITIEEPQKQLIAQAAAAPAGREAAQERQGPSSRLSRHYIRHR